jgi:hypothetical protein
MKMIEPPKEVLDCLCNEMNVNTDHFLTKYHSFDYGFKDKANGLLLSMLNDSIKASKLDSAVHYYEKGTFEQNDFMQAMFDCFSQFNTKKGLELHKAIYEHANRGGENWFPIVEITSPVADYSTQPEVLTLFRGCSLNEFESKGYRQSWSSSFDVAKAFAYTHYDIPMENRVVIKATVKNSDVA